MKKPFISIIIPTWRKNKILNRCLHSLLDQNYPQDHFEIIVVSKKRLNLSGKKIRTLTIPKNKNHAQARNIGVNKAKGKILAFCDDDCLLPKNWLLNASAYFTEKLADLISGPILPPKKISFKQRLSGYLVGSRFTIGFAAPRYRKLFPEKEANEFDLILANTFIKKSVFEKFGGFNRDQVPCEENFLYARLKNNGGKLLYVPKISCHHLPPSIVFPLAKKIFFYAQGRGAMIVRAPETFHPQYLIPSFFILISLGLLILSLFSLLAFSFLLATILVYLLLNLISAAYIFRQFEKNPLIFIIAPLATFVIHVSYGLGFLNGFILYLLGQKQAVKMPRVN